MLRRWSLSQARIRAQILTGHLPFKHGASQACSTAVLAENSASESGNSGVRKCEIGNSFNQRSEDVVPATSKECKSPQGAPHEGGNTSQGRFSSSREPKESMQGSVNLTEITKFAAMAETWWDTKGPYKPLHMINPVRLSFIRSALCRHFRRNSSSAKPLEGLTIVDVGCGGGLLCEPLARMGGQVIGIDAVEKNIKVAAAHSIKDPMTASIQYYYTTAEQLVQEQQQFDVVIALEVIEHVTEPKEFVKSLFALAKNGGAVVISTINRSITGYLLAVVVAEYLLQWLPKGTHEWSKFVTPDELALLMSHAGFLLQEIAGMVYNPLTQKWALSEDTNVNYIAFGTKAC